MKGWSNHTLIPYKLFDKFNEFKSINHLKLVFFLFYQEQYIIKNIYSISHIFGKMVKKSTMQSALKTAISCGHVISDQNGIYPNFDNLIHSSTKNNDGLYYFNENGMQVPNKVFEVDFPEIKTLGEAKTLFVLIRNILGYSKVKSYKDPLLSIAKKCGMSVTTVREGVQANVDAGRVLQLTKGNWLNGGTTFALSHGRIYNYVKKSNDSIEEVKPVKDVDEHIDYTYGGNKFSYPKTRRGDKSWRNISDDKLTYYHVLDAFLEKCWVPKHGCFPRQQDCIKHAATIKSIKKKGYTPVEMKRVLFYLINVYLPENNRRIESLYFSEVNKFIGKSREILL